MEYKPSELARDIGITTDTIYRSHIPAGAPARTDTKGNIWINGRLYRDWIASFVTIRKGNKPMADNQAYCLTCKVVREIKDPKIKRNKRNVDLAISKCPVCGKKIARYLKVGGKK